MIMREAPLIRRVRRLEAAPERGWTLENSRRPGISISASERVTVKPAPLAALSESRLQRMSP
jgi:hypothetical protein